MSSLTVSSKQAFVRTGFRESPSRSTETLIASSRRGGTWLALWDVPLTYTRGGFVVSAYWRAPSSIVFYHTHAKET